MVASKAVNEALAAIEQDRSKVLGLTVHGKAIAPGDFVPKADAQDPPELSYRVPSPEATYLVVELDLDPPFPSFPVLGPILHWIQPGLRASAVGASGSGAVGTGTGTAQQKLEVSSGDAGAGAPFIADYLAPGPPPPSAPHRYVFLLYEQPAGFDARRHAPPPGQKMGVWPRVRYDFDRWAREAQLGPLVAASYYNSN
ncbi:phosphatidylethanolamine-binding protein [Xylariaceae sp. FL0804]|nr:phosphatidylethanolamine-binding protein [Xylariaceae sp. FL0804]